jgi:hypothetical protein
VESGHPDPVELARLRLIGCRRCAKDGRGLIGLNQRVSNPTRRKSFIPRSCSPPADLSRQWIRSSARAGNRQADERNAYRKGLSRACVGAGLGVYVTTSFFSERVQREVIEDRYPLLLINGRRLAEEVLSLLVESRSSDLNAFLIAVDGTYDRQIVPRDPEEILLR